MDGTGKHELRAGGPPRSAGAGLALGQLVLVLLGAIALLWPAFVNGYPLVFKDSAWYLSPFAGGGVRHPGRTIGYSLFTGLALRSGSLWSIVVAQAFVTSALLVRVAAVAAKRPGDRIAFPAAALLAVLVLSGAAKYVSWVMADVTTSWIFLAGALWMFSGRRVDRAIAIAVASLAVLGHNTHVPLAIGTGGAVAVVAWLVPATRTARRSAATLLVVSLLSVPWAMGVNAVTTGAPSVFRGADSFLMYRLIDTGVVLDTLDSYCGERHWMSCRHWNEFAGHAHEAEEWFLFDPSSPFNTELGAWGGDEQHEIVVHAFRCCWDRIARTTLSGAWQQFWRIDSSDGLTQAATIPISVFLKRHQPGAVPALTNSRQGRGEPVRTTLLPAPEAGLHALLIVMAAAIALLGWRSQRRRGAYLIASVLFFLLTNALVCAFGSATHDRYQGRVAWLLPFAVAVSAGWLREDRDD